MLVVERIPVCGGNICRGYSWEIIDTDKLAEMVAQIAIGQYRHTEKILSGRKAMSSQATDSQKRGAINIMTVGSKKQPYHRDGWIFQAISWIVAHYEMPSSIIAKPHSRPADKGPDGLQIDLNNSGRSIAEIVIFEDKATINARDTIQYKVFPEIREIENGDRDHELTTEICGVIDSRRQSLPDVNYEEQIGHILLKNKHCYRISIATDTTRNAQSAHESLFKKFEDVATGDISRRRTNTVYYLDLRQWMNTFSDAVIDKIKGM